MDAARDDRKTLTEMKNSVDVRQLELSEREELLSFLHKAYKENPRQSKPEFWDWHFLAAPLTDTQDVPVWVAKSGNRIAGQLGAIQVELNIGKENIKAIWILDLVVDPDFRRQGLAKRLVLEAQKFCPVMLGVNTMEQHAPILLQSLGWKIVTKIPRFHKLLFPGEAVREISRWKPLRRIANLTFAPFRPHLLHDYFDRNSRLRFVEQFDTSFDRLWQESRGQWACAVGRDSKMLNWQYAQQPGKKFDVLGYFENDNLLGYVVLFFRKRDVNGAITKAAITDICYHPDKPREIVDELLKGSVQVALERKAGGLVTDVIDPLLEERLQGFGFSQVKNPLQLMVHTAIHQDVLYDPGKWFLTRGDSDISMFEEPNL